MKTSDINYQIDYEAVIRSAPDLYLILNPKFEIIGVSDAYLKSTMVEREKILGRNIFEVFPDNPNDPTATGESNLRDSLERVLQNKMPDTMAVQKYDIRLQGLENGAFEVRYWSPVNTPVLGKNSEVKYIIHRVEDVTEFIRLQQSDSDQRKFAEKLLSRAGQMETEIYLRAQKIQEANKQLIIAKEVAENLAKKAEEANNAKSVFLAAMSHEIRTPLNGVIGMTSLLQDTSLSSDQREYVETISMSGKILLAIINDILDYSKIESGRMEVETTSFDVRSLVEDSVEVVSSQAYRKGIAIGAYVDPEVPQFVLGDVLKIRQVLNNFLSNAAKFTEKGSVSLRVKLQKKQNKQITLLFEITDTGIGITSKVRQYLFEPFIQGDISITRKYGGTGLGLAISKRLVEMMGGTIGVESVIGEGSRFFCLIPFDESAATMQKNELLPQLTDVRILCIDENKINYNIIKAHIESWNMRCDIATSRTQALSMLKTAIDDKDIYKLVLIDPIISDSNGLELIREINGLENLPKIPIAVISSLGDIFTVNVMKQLGVSLSLTKPVRASKLYESIVGLLTKKFDKSLIHSGSLNNRAAEKQNIRILLVEDNFINQQVVIRMLAKYGYQADTVTNGIEALQAVQENSYNLILMDCQMPGMDGYTATAEIRKLEPKLGKHIPIIAMTANALHGDREKCIAAGMDDYIAKPIDIELLVELLDRWSHPAVTR